MIPKLRGARHWIHGTVGKQFLRLPLGTSNKDAANVTVDHIERALSEGQTSLRWPELKNILPPKTFGALATVGSYREPELKSEAPKPKTWDDLERAFLAKLELRIQTKDMAESTRERYKQTLRAFSEYLKEKGVYDLPAMDTPFIENFKLWRLAEIQKKKFSRGGRGLAVDTAILHRAFAIALKSKLVTKNPVLFDGRPGDPAEHGAHPFRGDQLTKLRQAAGEDLLAYLLLRWRGFRGSDAVRVTWDEVDWNKKELNHLTQKRKKRVVIPILPELLFALEAEYQRRNPQPDERILLHPGTGQPMTRPRLYDRMLALGKRAGVPNAHPHRFRDTFVVDGLARGMSVYDLAKWIADTVAAVERHYAEWITEARDRARRIMENGEGLEKTDCTISTLQPSKPGRVQ